MSKAILLTRITRVVDFLCSCDDDEIVFYLLNDSNYVEND